VFDAATFMGHVRFDQVIFRGRTSFEGARFTGNALFRGCEFRRVARFNDAKFFGETRFRVDSQEHLSFDRAQFAAEASFSGSWKSVSFARSNFARPVQLRPEQVRDRMTISEGSFDTLDVGGTYGSIAGTGVSVKRAFLEVEVRGDVDLDETTVTERLDIQHSLLRGGVTLRRAKIADARIGPDVLTEGRLRFDEGESEGTIELAHCDFGGHVSLRRTLFCELRIHDTRFSQAPHLGASYSSEVRIVDSTFDKDLVLTGSQFRGPVFLTGCRVARSLVFDYSRCEQRVVCEAVAIARRLVIHGTRFAEGISLRASVAFVDARAAAFEGNAHLVVRFGVVDMEHATFGSPSTLAGSRDQLARDESAVEATLRTFRPGCPDRRRPVLASLRGSDVSGGLVLRDLNLEHCLFEGAHGLDHLHLSADTKLGTPPRRPWVTRRHTIAEEHLWRRRRRNDLRWFAPMQWTAGLRAAGAPTPSEGPPRAVQVALTYRALRKAREDAKDAPGAADFFYGEMEMRREGARHATGLAAWTERILLNAYRVTSGYALRASRALAMLVAVITFGAGVFATYGFTDLNCPLDRRPASCTKRPPPREIPSSPNQVRLALSNSDAWVYSAESALPGVSLSQPGLTTVGRLARLVVRVLSPLLLGLGILALRGRVKR
jgi:hypothetical protein